MITRCYQQTASSPTVALKRTFGCSLAITLKQARKMTIDTQSETLVPINAAPSHIPTRPHVATVWRWIQRGVRGVRLDTVLIGGKRFTSTEAIARFIGGTTAASDPTPTGKTPTRSKARQAAIEQAEREFETVGSR